jgi:hypothetical protein
MARIAGTAYVKVDGDQYTLAGTLTVSPAAVTREGLAGLSGVAGYKEMPRVPFIEGEFYMTTGVSLPAIEAITNATITAELANGKVYVLRNAWHAGAIEANAGEGTFTARFEGLEGIEQ